MPHKPVISDKDLARLGPWKGSNNVNQQDELGKDWLRKAQNVDFTREGHVQLRAGYALRKAFTALSGFTYWNGKLVLSDNGYLVQCDPDTYDTSNITTITSGLPVSFAAIDNRYLYYMNGADSGKIDLYFNRTPILPESPPRQPTVTAGSTGALPAGTYQVAVTFVTSDGEETGTGLAEDLTITAGQSLVLSAIPQNSDAAYINIYMTEANDDRLMLQDTVAMGTTSYTLYSFSDDQQQLTTQFYKPLRTGKIIRQHHGYMLVAVNRAVVYSEPLQYGIYNPLDNYLPPFKQPVTVMESVEDGVWVVTKNQTWFLAGKDPAKFVPTMVFPYGAAFGTGRLVPASRFGLEFQGNVAYWFGPRGGVIGMPNGQFKPVFEATTAVDEYESGATAVVEQQGSRRLITSVRGKIKTSGFKVSDEVISEVRRNGIVIS